MSTTNRLFQKDGYKEGPVSREEVRYPMTLGGKIFWIMYLAILVGLAIYYFRSS